MSSKTESPADRLRAMSVITDDWHLVVPLAAALEILEQAREYAKVEGGNSAEQEQICGHPICVFTPDGDCLWCASLEQAEKCEKCARKDIAYSTLMRHSEMREERLTELERQFGETREALKRIARHPVRTPLMGRRDLGIPPLPACQDIAEQALARHGAETKASFVEKWSHGCAAVCATLDLWVARCPHCGMPSSYGAEGKGEEDANAG